jgi:hypothetical protein
VPDLPDAPWVTAGKELPDAPWAAAVKPEQPKAKSDSYFGIIPMAKAAYHSLVDAATLPGDVYAGRAQVPSKAGEVPGSAPLDSPAGQAGAGRIANMALTTSPSSVASRVGLPAVEAAAKGVPTAAEIKGAAQQGYEQAKNMGVEIAPQSIQNSTRGLISNLAEKGIDAELAPKTFSVLKKLENPPADSVATIANMESARRALGHAAKDFTNPTEQLAAKRAQAHLDDYLGSLGPADVLGGDAAGAAKILGEARGNYAVAKGSERVAEALTKADRQAAAAGAGGNIDNATRQQFKSILNSPKKSAGFTAEELAQMERVVEGTRTGNAARLVGKLAPTGVVSGALSAGAGMAAGGPVGAAMLPAVGLLGKKIGDMSTARQARILDEMIRSRAPMAQRAPMQEIPQSSTARNEIARLLLGSQGGQFAPQ